MLEVEEHRAVSPTGHRNSPLINSLFFLTSPTVDSFWSGSSIIASAVGSTPHAEQFLKEKAFPDICSELTALLLLPHFVSPCAPLQLPLHHHLSPADQSSPVRAEELCGELMAHTCSSPAPPPAIFCACCSHRILLLAKVLGKVTLTRQTTCAMHFLSHVQVFPT